MGLPELIAAAMLGSLILYALLGGADFGGGIWDLLASGRRAREQRALIDRAIAPVWEANHVWLVLIVVLLFTGFPAAFSAASVWLHVPLTLMLVGIVFRGSAFVFRTYDTRGARVERRWDRVFATSSLVPPFFLGVSVGAASSGALDPSRLATGDFTDRFVHPWLQPFPVLVGFFTLSLFAFLAAAYLTIEAEESALREDFRRRGMIAGIVAAIFAGVTAATSLGLPHVRARVAIHLGVPVLAAVCWLLAMLALSRRRYRGARVGAAGFVTLVIFGWALGHFPFIISPALTIRSSAAPDSTLRWLAIALGAGALVLFPSLYWLLRVFKRREVFGSDEED